MKLLIAIVLFALSIFQSVVFAGGAAKGFPQCLVVPALIPEDQSPSEKMKGVIDGLPVNGKTIKVSKLNQVKEVPESFGCESISESFFLVQPNFVMDANRYGVFLNKNDKVLVVEVSGLDGKYSFYLPRIECEAGEAGALNGL